ncbi:MAG: hypothetical protein OEW19_04915, partial [Acidobacteriota bacterium]|nr:hypothetical protein [Acidobacteriota bacterium]
MAGASFGDGLGRVRRASWVVVGLWVSTILVALPPAVVLRGMIADHLGASLMAEAAATGVNLDWWNEFLAQAVGIGQSFVPAVIGFAAVLDNLSRLADNRGLAPTLAGLMGAQIAVSLFLAGGVLDRLARDRALGAAAFFSACGVWFFRFLRLGVVAGTAYWLLFAYVHPWLFDTLYTTWTHDLTVERTAFVIRSALYATFAAMVCSVNVITDYAKIRAVVEDRRSMIGALASGVRFVARHPAQTGLLYLLNIAGFLLVVGGYLLAAPGASAGMTAFAVGQVFIVMRVVVRLQFAASQTALFQRALAHAGYVARPLPTWPES